jgi:hypothetical protein
MASNDATIREESGERLPLRPPQLCARWVAVRQLLAKPSSAAVRALPNAGRHDRNPRQRQGQAAPPASQQVRGHAGFLLLLGLRGLLRRSSGQERGSAQAGRARVVLSEVEQCRLGS